MHSEKWYEVELSLGEGERQARLMCTAPKGKEEAGEGALARSYPSGPLGVSKDPSSTGKCLQGPGGYLVIK